MINKYMKTKGQSPKVSKTRAAGLCFVRGGLAQRSNAADCKSVNDGHIIVLGFESPYPLPDINKPRPQR